MLYTIGSTSDGTEVYVNLTNSAASSSIARQPQLVALIKEALKDQSYSDPEIRAEYDMGRGIGYDFVVPTKEDDTIFYAKIVHEQAYSRFVKNKKPLPTQYIAITLKRSIDEQTYELLSAKIGRLTPPLPDTLEGNTAQSRHYWTNHALIHESEALQVSTICKICPY